MVVTKIEYYFQEISECLCRNTSPLHPFIARADVNENLKRIHGASAITDQEFRQLESCQAWKPFEKSSFRAFPQTESSSQVEVDFRMESMLESKMGLLS